MSEAGPVLYDTVELRRRIAGAFSAGELRALADSLGVGGINWDRGLQEAAREVVRQCERYAGLEALVARLREERPLVEWPEPMAAAAPGPGVPPPAAASPAPLRPAIPPTRAYTALPTLSSSPGAFGPPPSTVEMEVPVVSAPAPPEPPAPPAVAAPQAPSGPTFLDPYAPPPAPPVATPAVSSAPAPPPPPPRPAGWPGVVGAPGPAARGGGIDPRIFVAVAGLMVVAAVIAYLAGRASSATAGTEGAAAGTASPSPRAGRGDGPAALVSEALSRSFANLARVCELPSSAGTGAHVFRRVFERCGPAPPPRRNFSPVASPSGEASADPAPASPSGGPAPPRPRRPGRGGDSGPPDPQPAAKGCMGACDATGGACRAHCGAEPTEASAYDSYQRCLGQCLRDASRCRLGCR